MTFSDDKSHSITITNPEDIRTICNMEDVLTAQKYEKHIRGELLEKADKIFDAFEEGNRKYEIIRGFGLTVSKLSYIMNYAPNNIERLSKIVSEKDIGFNAKRLYCINDDTLRKLERYLSIKKARERRVEI